jgi:hypothetical protein
MNDYGEPWNISKMGYVQKALGTAVGVGDFDRIVLCVNALAGLDDEAVARLTHVAELARGTDGPEQAAQLQHDEARIEAIVEGVLARHGIIVGK